MLAGSSYQDDPDAGAKPLTGGEGGGSGDQRVTLSSAAAACRAQAATDCPAACMSSFRNRYLFANIVYFIYATGVLYIDLVAYPNAYTEDAVANVNRLYLAMGVFHLINATLYVWTWLPAGFGLCSPVQIPEYLNMLSAILYIWSATQYPNETGGTKVPTGYYYGAWRAEETQAGAN